MHRETMSSSPRSRPRSASLPTKLSFSDSITCIPPPEPYSTKNTWYTNHEMKAIRRQASLVVSAMRHSSKGFMDDEHICTYGLSHHVCKEIVKSRKASALSAVLDEQAVQRRASEIVDQDLIANKYLEVTKRNQWVATQRGKELAHEVGIMQSSSSTKRQVRRYHSSPLEPMQPPMIRTRRAC